MEYALKGVPVTEYNAPEGVVSLGGEWYYNEYAKSAGVSTLNNANSGRAAAGETADSNRNETPAQVPPPSDERKRILDLFKN